MAERAMKYRVVVTRDGPRARRGEQERAAAEIASDTSELLRRFAAQLSVGDAAVLLGVSKGRISQLRSGPGRSAATRSTGTDG
jgi:hypothetical protein